MFFVNLARKVRNKFFLKYAVRRNVRYGKRLHVGPGSVIEAPHKLEIGNDVYVGKYCTIECDGSIGNCVMIANQVGLIGRYDHDFSAVGTPIRFAPWIGDDNYTGKGREMRIRIEDDVWIGYGSIILSGVTIGRGAIIAAGSIITQDVPPYSIMAGVPAKIKGERFNVEKQALHETLLKQNFYKD